MREALTQFDPLWDELFPAEQAWNMGPLVERIDIGAEGLTLRQRVNGLQWLARGMKVDVEIAA